MSVNRLANIAIFLMLAMFVLVSTLSLQGIHPPYEDDSYIYLRYSRHLADGYGPVWNIDEKPVEGYTSVLFQGILTGTELIGWNSTTRSGWLGIGFSVISIYLTWILANRLNPDQKGLNLLAPLLLLLSKEFQYWTTAGMEIPLFILLLVASALAYVNWVHHNSRAIFVGFLLALAALSRPEGLVVFGITVLFEMGRQLMREQKSWSGLITIIVSFMIIQLPYQIWRWSYFGHPFPNTYYAKTGGGMAQFYGGINYLFSSAPRLFETGILSDLIPSLPQLLPVALATLIAIGFLLWPHPKTNYAYLSFLIMGLLFVVVYNGGDHFSRARFIVPVLPFVTVLLVSSVGLLLQKKVSSTRTGFAVLLIVILIVGWGYETGEKVKLDWADFRLSRDQLVPHAGGETLATMDLWGVGFIMMGQKLAEIASPHQSIAVIPIGSIGYYSGIKVFDMVGIVDEVIAHEPMDPAYTASWRPGHDKGNGQYILNKKPDYIQLVDRLTSQPFPGPDELSLRYKSIVEILELPEFEENYEFYPIEMENGWYYNLYRRKPNAP